MLPKKILLVFVLFAVFVSCRPKNMPQHSFYYWKTSFAYNDSFSQSEIKKLGLHHFYIHYCDIDWSENMKMPVPRGSLGYEAYKSKYFTADSFTPVVFITNRTFQRVSDDWCDTLAIKLSNKIHTITGIILGDYSRNFLQDSIPEGEWVHGGNVLDSMLKVISNKKEQKINEIQIDCDWNEGTKAKYFRFLKKFKELNKDKLVSVTIRLYPYKYPTKVGVPPVDKGMLMCYNLGNITNEATLNSIFDINELKKYMDGGKYPLPLDIALPLFSWQAWFRGGKYKGIIHGENFTEDTVAFKKITSNFIRFNQDTVINDIYFREGDELRWESPNQADLEKAVGMIVKKNPAYSRIVFFDWNENSIKRNEAVIQNIFRHY